MATARSLAKMTPEEIEEKVEALSPAWAKDYIRRLEGLTRALAAQLQAARDWEGGITLDNVIHDAAPADGQLHQHPEGTHSHPYTHPDHDHDTGNGQITEAVPAAGTFSNGVAPVLPSVWTPAGITPPDGEYATVRVVDGAANMEPVADLPDRAEIRFADFYQVHYDDHETTGGMQLLVVEGDGPIQVRPVSQTTVLISRTPG